MNTFAMFSFLIPCPSLNFKFSGLLITYVISMAAEIFSRFLFSVVEYGYISSALFTSVNPTTLGERPLIFSRSILGPFLPSHR